MEEIGEIDVDVDDRSAFFAEGLGEACGALDDFGSGVRGDGSTDDAVLKVNDDESGFIWIEIERSHGSPGFLW